MCNFVLGIKQWNELIEDKKSVAHFLIFICISNDEKTRN